MRMKWLLVMLASMSIAALPGVAQGFSGEWELEISLSPVTVVDDVYASLSLVYAGDSWRFASVSDFTSWWDAGGFVSGWVWQEFSGTGTFSFGEVHGDVLFGPQLPAFLYAQAMFQGDFAGIEVGLYSALLGPAVGGYLYPDGPYCGSVLKAVAPLGTGLSLTAVVEFGGSLPEGGFVLHHISGLTKIYDTSPLPGGGGFTGAELSVIGPFCGGSVKGTLRMEKVGFAYLSLDVWQVKLGCFPIVFGRDEYHPSRVRFTVAEKSVVLAPSVALAPGCLNVYAGVSFSPPATLEGMVIYGLGWECDLDGVRVGGLTALVTDSIWWIPIEGRPSQYRFEPAPPPWWTNRYEPLFMAHEFELVWLIFTGPACCGGNYEGEIDILFSSTGAVFGWSRTLAEFSVPLFNDFSFTLGMEVTRDGLDHLDFGVILVF